MYTPRGAGVSELGDIEIVAAGDGLHLFHLTLPNHDVIQHAVSQDGLSWHPLPAALRTGDPGSCDDDQIWTMSVTPRPRPRDGYVMLYTALSTTDDGRVQRIAMATSNDLVHWTKSPSSPVAFADHRWYEATPGDVSAVSFRDPKPVRVGEEYFATVCARENAGPLSRRGCVALLRSTDLETWDVLPPLFAPRHYWDLECPQLFQLGGGRSPAPWYLTAAIMEDRSQRYWVADEPTGPFRIPPDGDVLAPAGHYASRVARWHDMDLLFAWHQPNLAKGWQTTPATVDWTSIRNPFGKFLAPPLLLTSRDDSSLALRSFPGWRDRLGPWEIAGAESSAQGAINATSHSGMTSATSRPPTDGFMVEGILRLGGARGGLVFRSDGEGGGLVLELNANSRVVQLQRWARRRDMYGAATGPAFEIIQTADHHTPIRADAEIPVRVVAAGPYLEVSLDDEVVIAIMTGTPPHGDWGIWVEDGECVMQAARIAPLRRPGEDIPRAHRT
ncbi:MAG: hypothetical protein U0031_19975 [Thermomicrobiales bacterium]